MTDLIVHILPGGGQRVITVPVPGCDGFIASHWGPHGAVMFGHGMTRLEALAEVTEKILHRSKVNEGFGGL